MSFKSHTVSVKYAWQGVILGLRTQKNFRIHLVLSSIALLAGLFLKISQYELIIIVLMIGIGLAIEYLNTAIEFTVDLMTDKHHLLAKFAKDCAAASMLIFSIVSVVIALLIYCPYFKLWLFT